MELKNDHELFVKAGNVSVGKLMKPAEVNIEFSNGEPILKLHPNGDIFVKGRLVENDQEVVDGMRMLLGYSSPRQMKGLSFSKALELLKRGFKVKRAHWSGYWFYKMQVIKDTYGTDYNLKMIVASLASGGYAPAQAYQEDMIAEDWEVYE